MDDRTKFEEKQITVQVQGEKDVKVLTRMEEALQQMRLAKPDERGEVARRYAVAITEYEKVIAYFKTYIVEG